MESLASTLSTQPSSSSQPATGGDGNPANGSLAPSVDANAPPPAPVKRGPGRPKGSGVKKHVDPNAPIPPKRPVGRPRKDGLPAGSVPRGTTSASTRKRKVAAPGDFAASSGEGGVGHTSIASASAPPFSGSLAYSNYTYPTPTALPPQQSWNTTTTYSTLSAALQYKPTETSSAPPKSVHAVDPVLHDDWLDLLRTDAGTLLQSLVSSLQAPNPVSRAGMSVEDSFKFHVGSLAPQEGNGPIPQLYTFLKTFWLPWSPPYFSLTASSLTPTPPEHRFFYWDPLPLVFNGIACPFCAAPLSNRGCIRSAPTKVYDLGKPFFLIGCEYVCGNPQCKGRTGNEDRRFASTDPVVIRALPSVLRDELPVTLLASSATDPQSWNWQTIGVSKALWAIVVGCINEGLGKDATLRLVRAAQESFPVPVIAKDEVVPEDGPGELDLQHPPDAMHVDEPAHDAAPEGAAYTETWKGHPPPVTAQPEQSPPAPAPAPPTTSHVAAHPHSHPHPHPHAPMPAPYGYPQGAPYMPYAYGPYPMPYQPLHEAASIGAKEGSAKRIRHCVKCGSKDCKGKGGRNFCTNACQDCGEMECKGRNSKRPDKTCRDAWP
ncbi:hypothetical protein BC834DRAFT_911765 [Gloeopeniophorella convolvens]|nr:hypothetical protein BC834DRAFT_911765 [Gloeopeniophorella convolvens]